MLIAVENGRWRTTSVRRGVGWLHSLDCYLAVLFPCQERYTL